MFRYLVQWGCEYVRRKNGDDVHLTDYKIKVDDPHSYFCRKHRELCTLFVYTILKRAGHETLQETEDPGKSVFVDRLLSAQ